MPVVGLRCPDGTWVPVQGRLEVGRGFRGLDDEKASRLQFAVTSQDGSAEACLHVQALGINRMPKIYAQLETAARMIFAESLCSLLKTMQCLHKAKTVENRTCDSVVKVEPHFWVSTPLTSLFRYELAITSHNLIM